MSNSDLFLDLYKQLEDELENKYRNSRRKYSSVIIEFLRDEESASMRDELDVCREIRNILTHNANLEGVPIIEPSGPIVRALESILEYVRRPPLAVDYATKGDQVMKANLNQRVLRLMEVMEKNGFSHVPVMKEGRFCGVFSQGSIFMYVLKGGRNITKETTLQDMATHLKIEEHPENYIFLPMSVSYTVARNKFIKPAGRGKRISVIFITQTGHQDERLLGMLTPWDVLRDLNCT